MFLPKVFRLKSGYLWAQLSFLSCMTVAAPPVMAETATIPPLGFSVENMNPALDPRQDFYNYAAGTWLSRTQIPDSEVDVNSFTQVAAALDDQLLTLVKKAAATQAPAGSPQQQIGDYWRAAMDLQRLDKLGLSPLDADFKAIEALHHDASPGTLGKLSAHYQLNFGLSPFINLNATQDAKDSSKSVLLLRAPEQLLTQSEYAQPEAKGVREIYLKFITDLFKSIGDSEASAASKARTILSIETAISAAQLTAIQSRDPSFTYNKMTMAQAQALIPSVDLQANVQALGIKSPEFVQVHDVAAIKASQQILTTRSREDLQTLLRWHVLSARALELGKPWRDLRESFDRQYQGLTTLPARERAVTQAIGVQLFHPLSRLYIETYFSDSTRLEVTQMVEHIKDEFKQRLLTNVWLDAPTRTAALDKLSKIDIQVGYPQNWIDFSPVLIRPDDHFGNTQRIRSFLLQHELQSVGKPFVPERFASPPDTTPIAVNAAYTPETNSIDINAAILQPPFFVPGADSAVNYCTVGAVIGHEITHGFDSFGRQFGPTGNLRDWWTPQATAEFKKRTDVLVKQYSDFTLLPGLKHNGELTLTENIADLGGITLAHAALQRSLLNKPQPKIGGLSTDQRCFVAWAQMWAYKGRPERIRFLATVDYHASSTLRGFVPLLHLDAFHNAFGTRPGDPMWRSPEQRVQIW